MHFQIDIQTIITKETLILHNLKICVFLNVNNINQHDFPGNNLTNFFHQKPCGVLTNNTKIM